MASALRKLFDVNFAYSSHSSCFQLRLQRSSGKTKSTKIQQQNQKVNSMAEKTKPEKKQGRVKFNKIIFSKQKYKREASLRVKIF